MILGFKDSEKVLVLLILCFDDFEKGLVLLLLQNVIISKVLVLIILRNFVMVPRYHYKKPIQYFKKFPDCSTAEHLQP